VEQDIAVSLQVDGLEDPYVLDLVGMERLDAASEWSIEVVAAAAPPPADLVGIAAGVTLTDPREGSHRLLPLVVERVVHRGIHARGVLLRLELSEATAPLQRKVDRRVFLGKSTTEIVESVLVSAGLPASLLVRRLTGTYRPILQCVQSQETDWQFIRRLLAEEGIAFWFDPDPEGVQRLVLTDHLDGHETIEPPTVLVLTEDSGMFHARSIKAFELTQALVPEAYSLRRYDVRHPTVALVGSKGESPRHHFEYPARVLDADHARDLAAVRLEQVQRDELRGTVRSDCIRLVPGRRFTLEGTGDAGFDARYLVVAARHAVRPRHIDLVDARAYSNEVVVVPEREQRTYRPAVPRHPRRGTTESVISTGAAGEEIHVDDLGRIKHRWLWDRSGLMDDKASEWARCLQMGMGGSMFLPRVGWELPIMYMDGAPDEPFVLGRLYNATAVVPYALPGGSAMASFQSATSPGGGTTNEVRFGDSGGAMEMFIHASKDQTVNVGGSSTTKVSSNATHDVALSHSVFVGGSQTHTVGSNQTVGVATDHGIALQGSRTEMVGGLETNNVTGNRYVAAKGSYTELVGAAYLQQCNQANYRVGGAFTLLVGGSYGNTAGMTTGDSVAAARTELVGGGRSITVATTAVDNVTGLKRITAGPTTEKASGKVAISGTAAGSLRTGGALTVDATGNVELTAANITLEVSGNLDAEHMVLSGGTLHAKSGTTAFKGRIKRGAAELK